MQFRVGILLEGCSNISNFRENQRKFFRRKSCPAAGPAGSRRHGNKLTTSTSIGVRSAEKIVCISPDLEICTTRLRQLSAT